MANYTQLGLDLQSLSKRIYSSLLYNSTFYNFLNEEYFRGTERETPMIEVLLGTEPTVNVRQTPEIASALTPALAGYNSVKVDLTELPMDYSFRIPVLVLGSGVENAIQDAIAQKDSAVAKAIDTYGYGKLDTEVSDPSAANWTGTDYVANITNLKAQLFNNNAYGDYRLGLVATEYAKVVASLTSVLKFETMAGIEGVDRGTVGYAYGVSIFPINDNYIVAENVVGYIASKEAVVGDTFFDSMVQETNSILYPGYFCVSGNILFGAKVIHPNAIIKLMTTV